jgi:transketolase
MSESENCDSKEKEGTMNRTLTVEKKEFLEEKARFFRKEVIEVTYKAQSGHPGGSLSLAEIMAVLYFHTLNYDVKNPKSLGRDRVILSKGHAAPIWYVTLADAGFFPKSELAKLREIDSLLQGHPCVHIPGVDATTGSLGLGLSAGCGMAIAAKLTKRDSVRVYVILGDGELAEGQVWEAAMSATHFKLDNLTAIVDRNRYQNDGRTEEIMTLEPLRDKWQGFGWHTTDIDGHDVDQIANALDHARKANDKPAVVIANTVKGKGVSYLIDKAHLHYAAPTAEQRESALKDLGF